jgi:catechol 2,3-dioxygenase-like lactoylglutathione lyase family enzyme
MSDEPTFRLTGPVLDSPDPRALGAFYRDLLGWKVEADEPSWVKLGGPGGESLAFQLEPLHQRPVWPSRADAPQMQLHLDIEVSGLESAGQRARALGATLADFQPQDDVRVWLDPDGHPFCLWAG